MSLTIYITPKSKTDVRKGNNASHELTWILSIQCPLIPNQNVPHSGKLVDILSFQFYSHVSVLELLLTSHYYNGQKDREEKMSY